MPKVNTIKKEKNNKVSNYNPKIINHNVAEICGVVNNLHVTDKALWCTLKTVKEVDGNYFSFNIEVKSFTKDVLNADFEEGNIVTFVGSIEVSKNYNKGYTTYLNATSVVPFNYESGVI